MVITAERSTTVAPLSSAWARSSAGIHFASRPKTGSLVASPGSEPRKSPMARMVPGGASPRATSMSKSLMA